jgi:hypothetical protein
MRDVHEQILRDNLKHIRDSYRTGLDDPQWTGHHLSVCVVEKPDTLGTLMEFYVVPEEMMLQYGRETDDQGVPAASEANPFLMMVADHIGASWFRLTDPMTWKES